MGHDLPGHLSDEVTRHGDVAPAEDDETLLDDDLLDPRHDLASLVLLAGDVGGPDGVGARCRQVEVDGPAQEAVRDLREDPGSVADERVGARGAAVLEVGQRQQRLVDDVVPGGSAHRGDHRDAAGVVLRLTAVEAGVGGVR